MSRQPTAPHAVVIPTAQPRSGWGLRLLFGLVFGGLVAAATTVALLVAFTFQRLGAPAPAADSALAPAAVQPIVTPGAEDPEAVNVWDKHGPVHILLLGLDADDCGRSTSEAQRTDTMILVRVDPATRQVAMLSIPRDLYVYIDDRHGAQKITTANVYGTEFEDGEPVPHSGPRLVKRVVEANLGLPVHRYVRVDFAGFKRVVDALDGVDIDVPPSRGDPTIGLVDHNFPDGRCGTMTITFEAGRQHMDGERALQYARSRYSTSDFDRSRRQMEVLLAIRERATSLGVILDLPHLIPALMDTVSTDLTADEILSLARLARGIDAADVVRLQIDENVADDDRVLIGSSEQWILRLRPDAYGTLKAQFLDPSLIPTPTAPATQTADVDAAGAGTTTDGTGAGDGTDAGAAP